MSYFNYTDLLSSLLDPTLVDPGSTLIYVGAYDSLDLFAHRVLFRMVFYSRY